MDEDTEDDYDNSYDSAYKSNNMNHMKFEEDEE
jgi:hypothetical protein